MHGQYVMVAVSDTGGGMSKEVMERAFEPFFTTKPTGMGTGLGLSMVYGFVKQSTGHIKIYSEIGEGTTIKLYFPRLAEQRDLPAWSDEQRTPARPSNAAGGSETILLVEDDEEVNRFACEVLREQGYNVLAASDGASALRLLESEPKIALLFTDVVLPGGMNGRQLAGEARKRRPDLKVLYATGYTRNAIIHHGRLDADVELLTKPFTAETLARKVRQILDARPAAHAAGEPEPATAATIARLDSRADEFQSRNSIIAGNQCAAHGFFNRLRAATQENITCPPSPSAPCSGRIPRSPRTQTR